MASKRETPQEGAPSDPPPNREDLNKKIAKLRSKIEGFNAKLQELDKKDTKDPESDKLSDERRGLQARIKEMRDDIDAVQSEKTLLRNRISEIDAARRERQDMMKTQREGEGRAPFESLEEIEAEIRRLQFKQETGTGGLKQEAKLRKEVKDLNVFKSTFTSRQFSKDELTKMNDERNGIIEQLQAIQEKIEGLRKDREGISEKLSAVSDRQNVGKGAQQTVRQERQGIRDQTSKCYDEIRKLRTDFDADYTAWRQKKDEERQKEQARRQLEQKERAEIEAKKRQQREEEYREREELRKAKDLERTRKAEEFAKFKKMNPHEDEITQCDILIQYLTQPAPKIIAAPKPKSTTSFDAAKFAQPGMVAFKKKPESEEKLSFGAKKAPAPKPKEPKAPKPASDPVVKPKVVRYIYC